MIKRFTDNFEEHVMIRCAILPKYPEDYVRDILNKYKPKKILEIGTFNGIMTAFLASFPFVEKVITLDITDYKTGYNLWKKMRVFEKISFRLIKNNKEKAGIIKEEKYFDFVFIDGEHSYKGIKLDYELVKDKTKLILFHDYGSNPYMTPFIQELGNKITHKRIDLSFALMEKK